MIEALTQDDQVLDDYEGFKYHNFNGITSRFGAHFILIIDKILIKEQYEKSILEKTTLLFPLTRDIAIALTSGVLNSENHTL